jgi:hypothetical protein
LSFDPIGRWSLFVIDEAFNGKKLARGSYQSLFESIIAAPRPVLIEGIL